MYLPTPILFRVCFIIVLSSIHLLFFGFFNYSFVSIFIFCFMWYLPLSNSSDFIIVIVDILVRSACFSADYANCAVCTLLRPAHFQIFCAAVFTNSQTTANFTYGRTLCFATMYSETAVAQWLRCCATNRKVASSIPDGVIGIFHWHYPSDRTMALESNQPLTEMSTRRISWG